MYSAFSDLSPRAAAADTSEAEAMDEEVRRLTQPFTTEGHKHPAGMFFVTRKPTTLSRLEKIAAELGTRFVGDRRVSPPPVNASSPQPAGRLGRAMTVPRLED